MMGASKEFKTALHESIAQLGSGINFDLHDKVKVDSFSALRSLILELRAREYLAVSMCRNQNEVIVGLMSCTGYVPSFFSLAVRTPAAVPETKGLCIAFLGPDGVGKTTTVERVMSAVAPVFSRQHLFHWRPQVLKPRTADDEVNGRDTWTSINRHGDPPRGLLLSLMRLGGVFADYYLGQFNVIAPALKRGELVVFDRYYHDILVDSKRYRYGGPEWLLRGLKYLLPQREVLYVILDADDRIILSRKQEVSPQELRLQRQRYSELAQTLPECVSARTDLGEKETLRQVMNGVGLFLAKRVERQLSLPPRMSQAVSGIGIEAEGKLA